MAESINMVILNSLLVLATWSQFGQSLDPQDKPLNIIFLMADQLRSDALGCYGSKLAQTPNIDKLAAGGARFTNAYTSTPSCTPARTVILTSLSPWYNGMLGYGPIAPRYPIEMPRVFSSAGWYAYSIGKDHFGWNSTTDAGISHGYNKTDIYDGLPIETDDYDVWLAEKYPGVDPLATGLGWNDYRGRVYALDEYFHPTSWVGRKAVEFIRAYDQKHPLFLKISFHRPHSPYDPPGRHMEKFRPEEMPKPYLGNNWDSNCNFSGPFSDSLCCGNVDEKDVAISRQAYYASTSFVDEWIGRIMEELKNRSMLDNSVILFTADHGDMLGDHFRWRKGLPYESAAKIPMILVWPPSLERGRGGPIATPRGSSKEEVTELRDVFPTFLEATGLPIPSSLNGSSLIDLLKEDCHSSSSWREYIDFEHSIYCNKTFHWNGYTSGKLKYIFNAYSAKELLFDLVNDPHEMNNLAEEPRWQSELLMWRKRLIEQFEREGRGPEWVKDGVLQRRVKGQTRSPHYPGDKGVGCLKSLPQTDDTDCNVNE